MTTPQLEPATQNPTDGSIHTWFSLSYCNYQVLHRTLMQSMPIEWQERMVACLEEMAAGYQHIELPEAFNVEAGEQHLVDELTEQQMRRLGITRDEYDDDPPDSLKDEDRDAWEDEHRLPKPVFYDANINEVDGQSYVVVPTFDPVPHYNRGRTYIPPAGQVTATPATPPTALAADLHAASARLRAECTGRGADRYVRIAAGWLDEWAETATAPTPGAPRA